jgi:pimeloyl-ACP methyl ester carboxylesterase
VKLATARRGHGPLLVCHPGGPGFDGGELLDLGGLDATRELLLVDPRGTGRTAAAGSYELDDYVADLEELRDDLGLERIDLLGFSHGALVAIAYAVAHPSRVRKLVSVGGFVAWTPEVAEATARNVEARRGEAWFAEANAAFAHPDRTSAEAAAARWNRMVPLYFSRWDERYRPLVEVERLPVEPLVAFEAADFDLRPRLSRVTAETLVLTGRDDFICGEPAAKAVASGIERAELVLLDGAGHFPFVERPEAFRSAVESFLSR